MIATAGNMKKYGLSALMLMAAGGFESLCTLSDPSIEVAMSLGPGSSRGPHENQIILIGDILPRNSSPPVP